MKFLSKISSSLIVGLFLTAVNCVAGDVDSDNLKERAKEWMGRQSASFIENQGQFTDMAGMPVPNVLFEAEAHGRKLFITETGFTLMFYDKIKRSEEKNHQHGRVQKRKEELSMKWERIDMNLQGASIKKENIVKEMLSSADYNYFNPHFPSGIYGVKKSEKIIIRDVYPGIDWVLYSKGTDGIKYDFVVHPGANPNQIGIIYSSKEPLDIDDKGAISINTGLGVLVENRPLSYQGTREVITEFLKKEVAANERGGYDTHVKFSISDYDASQLLVIDPVLFWGSYYGAPGSADGFTGVAVDGSGNIFVSGYSGSISAFPTFNAGGGSYYQGTNGGSFYDAVILKFSNAGALIWATFYGGGGSGIYPEGFNSIAVDATGNVFVVGATDAANFPTANPGGGTFFQGASGGGNTDVCVVKFDNAGVRLWATYYGGSGSEDAYSVSIDGSNNVFVAGYTASANFPTLNPGGGAYFQAFGGGAWPGDMFILKFNNLGVRLWATYYGGSGAEEAYSVAVDGNNDVYVTGTTTSANLPTLNPGGGAYFQGANAGGDDACILKFGNTGIPVLATYYGGSGDDFAMGVEADANNNVFIIGNTDSPNLPTLNPGGGAFFQATFGGGSEDIFLLKCTNAGAHTWATYYGGSGRDSPYQDNRDKEVAINNCGDVFFTGFTQSANFPTQNPGSGSYFQAAIGSTTQWDAYILQFSNTGVRQWATYSGTTGRDFGGALAIDQSGDVFYVGESHGAGNTGLANPGGGAYYDATYVAGNPLWDDCFIMKFTGASTMSATVSSSSSSCAANNGTATVTVTTGTPPYTYLWNPTGQTTSSATGLAPGNYTVTVNDPNGCPKTYTVAVLQQGALTATTTATPASCGNNNGTVSVALSGGTSPYTYSWSPAVGSTSTATGLGAGSYSISITDGNGCTTSQAATVTQSSALTAAITFTPATCGNSNGSATVTPGGGTSPYTYSWSFSGGSAPSATGLAAGTYSVSVTDAGGCSSVQTVTITMSPGIATTSSVTSTTCGSNTGTASVVASGGTSPFTYSWSPSGGAGATATGLGAGTYIVIVTDANGCTQADTAIVSNSNGPNAVLSSQTNVLCNAGSNGSATVGTTGGTTPYTYSWSPSGGANASATGLTAGSYTVTVSDATGCSTFQVITITQPAALTVSLSTVPVCVANNGTATVAANGGTGPYTYAWLPAGGNAATASGLASGSYTCTITDSNGCTQSAVATVVANSPPVAGVASNVTITQGQTTTLAATGGSFYVWSNGVSGALISVAPPSTMIYCVTVTDANGCTDTACATVTVELLDCSGAGVLFIPNAFSPNDDGENDVVKLYYGNYDCIEEYKLSIYNRWGELVFETTDVLDQWNGTYQSRMEGVAVYSFFMSATLITGEEIRKKGNISLLK